VSYREPSVPNARVAQPLAARTREPLPQSRVQNVAPAARQRQRSAESLPDWEDTPLLPLRIMQGPVNLSTLAPISQELEARTPIRHLRPIELWFVVALTMVFTLVGSALLARFGFGGGEVQQSSASSVSSVSAPNASSAGPLASRTPASPGEHQIPIVAVGDLPLERGPATRRHVATKPPSR